MPMLILALMLAPDNARPFEEGAVGITRISATNEGLEFTLSGIDSDVLILEMEPMAPLPAVPLPEPLWRGRAETVRVPRHDGQRDRLFAKFVLVDAEGQLVGVPRFVDDIERLPARDFDFPWPDSIKGLQVQLVDDAIALGVKYAGYNLGIPQVIDSSGQPPRETWTVDGYEIPINMGYIEGLDQVIKGLTDAGINVTGILNNMLPLVRDPSNPLIHPNTDVEGAPFHLGAINVMTPEGIRYYRAAIEFLADRYSRPDGRYGWITGYIVGNEVQAHSIWYNIGPMPLEGFVEHYGVALRITDLAVRSIHGGIRTYVSLEHHWAMSLSADPLTAFAGRDFLLQLTQWSRAGGDFPWHVAFHPYPENLFEPRAWNDTLAPTHFEAPKITFRNIEVLPAFLAQEEMLYRGEARRIILSEQGFHTPDGPDGEDIQAAAYAWAYYRVARIPSIEAFILHRHVDHKQEFGLRLGLWTWKEDGGACDPDRQKRVYEVFRLADTEQWEDAFAFALPIVGIDDWSQADPVPAEEIPIRADDDGSPVVYDLYLNAHVAKLDNCPDWRRTTLPVIGIATPAIFHHPPNEGIATASFDIALPYVIGGETLTLRFMTAISAESEDGVLFEVRVDGEGVFFVEQTQQEPIQREVDLTPFAGRTTTLELCTGPIGNATRDWAHWVSPSIVSSVQ